MSTKNTHPTFQYSQPDEYRLSHDSVFLARTVFELEGQRIGSTSNILDLGSGCGVVGMDFLFHMAEASLVPPQRIDFLEVQQIYQDHFYSNKEALTDRWPSLMTTKMNLILENYRDYRSSPIKYDLIVSNPPYFLVGQGKLSPFEFKNRCRFFIDGSFAELLQSIEDNLAPQGRAYLLLRSWQDHGLETLQMSREILKSRQIHIIDQIRGTDLAVIR